MAKKKNKTFTKREVNIYALGFRDGENQLQRSINKILAVHQDLAEELLRLDIDKPVVGDPRYIKITLRITTLKKIIRALGKDSKFESRGYYQQKLLKLLVNHEEELQKMTAQIEKGLLKAK